MRIPNPLAFGVPNGALLLHTISSENGSSPFGIRQTNENPDLGIPQETVFEVSRIGRIYAGTFNNGIKPNGYINALHSSGVYSPITNSSNGFGSITHGVSNGQQRIGWTSGNTTEDKKLHVGYGLAPGQHGTGFPASWGYNYRSVLTLDMVVDEENEHFANMGINTENPTAPLHVKYTPTAINDGPSGNDHGLLIENNGWKSHDYALRVNSHHGDILRLSNAGELFIGRDLNGDAPGDFKLYVQDGIRTERLRVDIAAENDWADYVFEDDYVLIPIDELETFIKENKHLPGVPSAAQVVKEGVDVGEMNAVLLRHIEELTLRMIEMQKEINELKDK